MKYLICVVILLSSLGIKAQNKPKIVEQFTQTIRGVVIDAVSGSPLSFVSVGISDKPELGVTTDEQGNFVIKNVPIGRHTIQATCVGYNRYLISEIMVSSSKEVYLEIPMTENAQELGEVVVSAYEKDAPLNKMALTGARMLGVEEAGRFAGGLDDPARLVSSFAGVASTPSSNGISVHGNAPHLLQWKLEDIEIPNPNHFADIATLGGGVLSSLSNKILGNSDFLSAAFPAEYGNAVSGVFDMQIRNGNTEKHEHTLQVGTLGIDLASEGPISKKHNSSYIIKMLYTFKPKQEVADSYVEILKDVSRERKGGFKNKAKSITPQIETLGTKLITLQDKWLDGKTNDSDYHSMKERIEKQIRELKFEQEQILSIDTNFDSKLNFGLNLLSNLDKFFAAMDIETKYDWFDISRKTAISEKSISNHENQRVCKYNP